MRLLSAKIPALTTGILILLLAIVFAFIQNY